MYCCRGPVFIVTSMFLILFISIPQYISKVYAFDNISGANDPVFYPQVSKTDNSPKSFQVLKSWLGLYSKEGQCLKIEKAIKKSFPENVDQINMLRTFYLTTDDNTLYYIIFGLRHPHSNGKSFVLFRKIHSGKNIVQIVKSYSSEFVKKGEVFLLKDNSITDSEIKVDIKANKHLVVDLSYKGEAVDFSQETIGEKDQISCYIVKALRGTFRGKITIDGKTEKVSGRIFADKWLLNTTLEKGHWEWGLWQGDDFSVMHFKTYADSVFKKGSIGIVWRNSKLFRKIKSPKFNVKYDKRNNVLSMSYDSNDFSFNQKINYRKIPDIFDPTWYAPSVVNIKYKNIKKKVEGSTLVEHKY